MSSSGLKQILPRSSHKGRILGACFHPEITTDTRIHGFFRDMAAR